MSKAANKAATTTATSIAQEYVNLDDDLLEVLAQEQTPSRFFGKQQWQFQIKLPIKRHFSHQDSPRKNSAASLVTPPLTSSQLPNEPVKVQVMAPAPANNEVKVMHDIMDRLGMVIRDVRDCVRHEEAPQKTSEAQEEEKGSEDGSSAAKEGQEARINRHAAGDAEREKEHEGEEAVEAKKINEGGPHCGASVEKENVQSQGKATEEEHEGEKDGEAKVSKEDETKPITEDNAKVASANDADAESLAVLGEEETLNEEARLKRKHKDVTPLTPGKRLHLSELKQVM
ncbi:hypothetical protein KEM55_003728 [Ascosphaera atra]|nr:hypothetical protein KEM55_003728 [Ascosphaera atra]